MKVSTVVCLAICCMLLVPVPMMMQEGSNPQSTSPAMDPPRDLAPPVAGKGTAIGEFLRPAFLENKGQLGRADVAFYAEGDGMTVGFRRGGVLVALETAPCTTSTDLREEALVGEVEAFDIIFDGCRDVAPAGVDEFGFASNYLVGNDHSRWVRGARSFREVVYEGLWDGVDLRYYFRDGMLKYDFMVGAGVLSTMITMRYSGDVELHLDPATGDLVIMTGEERTLRDLAPLAYQMFGNRQEAVDCSFVLSGDGRVGFRVGQHDPSTALVIDPGLLYSTFIGGSGSDYLTDVKRGPDGSVYLCGVVDGGGFPVTAGGLDLTYNRGNFVLIKLDPGMTRIEFATYCGGKHVTQVSAVPAMSVYMMTVRADGSILLTGDTLVDDMPVTPDALQPKLDFHFDCFIVVISADGAEVQYCSYFGGNFWDGYLFHYIDEDGELYLAGSAASDNLPTTQGAFCQTLSGSWDIFVAKLDPTYTKIEFCSYIGGSGYDDFSVIHPLDIDDAGNIYLTGITTSEDFPITSEAYCDTLSQVSFDGYALKMSPDASSVLYCSYFGGDGRDWPFIIEARSDGSIAIAGHTTSTDLPVTEGCLDGSLSGSSDTFVAVLDTQAPGLLMSTYLGREGEDELKGGVYDPSTDVLHLMAYSNSDDLLTTVGCYNPRLEGEMSNILMSIDLQTGGMAYSTYIGNAEVNFDFWGPSMSLESDGSLLVIGQASSGNFPTTSNAMDRSYNGGAIDAVLLRLDPRPVGPPPPPTTVVVDAMDGHVNISWSPVIEESYVTTGYVVQWGEDPSTLNEIDVSALRYTHKAVRNGNKYYYRVAARNSAGVGTPSDVHEAIPMGLPSAPTAFNVTTGDGSVHLGWSPPATTRGGHLIGYHVWKGEESGSTSPVKWLGVVGSWTDDSVQVGARYTYHVVAVNERGNGTPTEDIEVVVTEPPGSPTSFEAVAGPGRVVLSWEPPSSAGGVTLIGYHVLRGTSTDPMDMVQIASRLPNDLTYTDLDVVNGTNYNYWVVSFTVVNRSKPAGPQSAMPYGPPGPPSNLRLTPGDGQVLVEWSAPENDGGHAITGYRIYAGPASGALTFRASTTTVVSSYLSGLVNGEVVLIAVATVNELGEGDRCEAVGTTPYGLPSMPVDFAIAVGSYGVRLTWKPPEDFGGASALSYQLERGVSREMITTLATVDGLAYLDSATTRGGTYFYRMHALNPLGKAGAQTELLRADVANVPGPVVGVVATPGDGFVRLAWQPPTDDGGAPVLNYSVLRKVGAGELLYLAVVHGGTVLLDEAVVNGQTYQYIIVALNVMGEGARDAVVEATPMQRPSAPWDLMGKVDGSRVSLSWMVPLGDAATITGYIVYRGTSPDDLVPVAEVADLQYTDDDVARGTRYYYRVSANSSVGEGDQSQTLEVPVGAIGLTSTAALVVGAAALMVIVAAIVRWQYHRRRPPGGD